MFDDEIDANKINFDEFGMTFNVCVINNSVAIISGIKRLISVVSDEIVFEIKKRKNAKITGKDLVIDEVDSSRVKISGKINAILFEV